MLTYPHYQSHRRVHRSRLWHWTLHVHWYGIMYLIGFVGAWWLARYRARRARVRPGCRSRSMT